MEEAKQNYMTDYSSSCGKKNPSVRNEIGQIGGDVTRNKKKKKPDFDKILSKKKSARRVFKDLQNLPDLSEIEKRKLKRYLPSFTRQTLDYRNHDVPHLGRNSPHKARILYGNETDPNEYPWQVCYLYNSRNYLTFQI